uniref:Uncharacterized protein n=1 Tax=Meloidogyne javanica TaxID=6303 RepID=A0A915LV52_MELJA
MLDTFSSKSETITNGVPSYSNGPDCVQISNGGNSQGEFIFPQNVGNKKSQQNGCNSACVGSMCVKTSSPMIREE